MPEGSRVSIPGRREPWFIVLVALLLLLSAASAPAAGYLDAGPPEAVVRGQRVTLTTSLNPSGQPLDGLRVCVLDASGRERADPPATEVVRTPEATVLSLTIDLPPGSYRSRGCAGRVLDRRDLTATSSFTVAPVARPVGMAGSWRSVFAEEFDGTRLDTDTWSTGWFGSGVTSPVNDWEPVCYDPAQVELGGDSTLAITLADRAQDCGDRTRPWSSGLISTNGHYDYTYGATETRMYLPPGETGKPANWPAFWANGQDWPATGENDVMESIQGVVGPHFHSPAGGPGFEVPGDWSGWHTFGSLWEPGQISYFYDGRYVGRLDTGRVAAPMYLVLNYAADYGGATVPARMQVDYVRVWQRG